MNLTPLDERRLAELKQFVAARAVVGARQPARRPVRRMLRPTIGVGAAAGVAAIALAVTSGGLTSVGGTPAFAVTRNADGIVTITLTDYRHTAQLSQELRRLGIPAAVFYIPAGEYCYQPLAREVYDPPSGLYTVPEALPAGKGWRMRINTPLFRPGQTLLFGLTVGTVKLPRDHPPGIRSNQFYGSSTFLVTGQATACQYRPELPVATPVLPPGTHMPKVVVVAASGDFLFPNSIKARLPSGK